MHVLDRGKKYCTTWMKGLCDPLNRFTRPSQKRVFTVPNRLTNTFFPSFFFIPFKGIFAYGLVTNILSYETLRPLFVNVYTDTCVYNVYVYIYIYPSFKETEAVSFVRNRANTNFHRRIYHPAKIPSLFNPSFKSN